MTADAVGGVFTYVLGLGALLTKEGIDVHVATMGPRPNDKQRRAAREAGVTLHSSDFRLEWMEAPWEDVDRAGQWLLGLERDTRPDVIHLNGYCHGTLPWQAPVIIVAHSCVLSWWRAVRGEAAPSSFGEYRKRVAEGLEAADLVIAPTRAMLACLDVEYGVKNAGLVIHHAGDASAFHPGTKGEFILAAGRLWDDAKNVAALAKVAGRTRYPILVAGSDTPPGDSPRPRPHGIHTLGELGSRELANLMARAAIYALPARYEPFGLSILEAALSECALVLGDIPSLRELWEGAALFVEPEDERALGDALELLTGDEKRRQYLARRARTRALELRPDDMAAAYRGAYERVIEGRKRRAAPGEPLDSARPGGASCA